jgi:hypothetical protein
MTKKFYSADEIRVDDQLENGKADRPHDSAERLSESRPTDPMIVQSKSKSKIRNRNAGGQGDQVRVRPRMT